VFLAMQTMSLNRYLPRAILFGLGSLLLLGLSLARAQQVPQYEEDALDPRAKDWKRVLNAKDNEVLAMLLGSQTLEVGKMDAYFKKDVFPHFTQVNNAVGVVVVDAKTKKTATSTVLPRLRADFRKFYFNQIGIIDNDEAGKSREQLNKLLNTRLFQIVNNQAADGAKKNYHPLVRFHAALFLSELTNENPGKQLPYAPALGNLYMLAAPKKTPNVPESVRVVALKGILQHSNAYKIDEARVVPLLVNEVIQPWLTMKSPTGDLTQEGLDWIRRRAMELALELNAKSSDPTKPAVANLPQLIAAIAADDAAGISLRIGALNMLTGFKEPPAGVKDEDLGKAAGAIALASAKMQLHSIKTQPVPPNVAKPLKHDLTLVNNSLDVLAKRSAQLTKLQENVLDLLEACDTRWEDVQDPDAMYKEIQKSAAKLDMFLTGKATSDLLPNFVQIPKGFNGADKPHVMGGQRMPGGEGRIMGGGGAP
jgi:hypothetical protein